MHQHTAPYCSAEQRSRHPFIFLSVARDSWSHSKDSHLLISLSSSCCFKIKSVWFRVNKTSTMGCFWLSTRLRGGSQVDLDVHSWVQTCGEKVHLSLLQWSLLASCKHKGEAIASGWVTLLSVFISHILSLQNPTPTVGKHSSACCSLYRQWRCLNLLYFLFGCMPLLFPCIVYHTICLCHTLSVFSLAHLKCLFY